MTELINAGELANILGVSRQAVQKAQRTGRLSAIGGKFDPTVAKIQWETNRRRRPARPKEPAGEAAQVRNGGQSPSGEGSGYWVSKTRRETAEASKSELELAKMAGTLVLRAEIDRTLFGAARVMRDQMLALAPRLAATLAPISDPAVIERRIDAEIRVALAAFAQQVRAGGLLDVNFGQPG